MKLCDKEVEKPDLLSSMLMNSGRQSNKQTRAHSDKCVLGLPSVLSGKTEHSTCGKLQSSSEHAAPTHKSGRESYGAGKGQGKEDLIVAH